MKDEEFLRLTTVYLEDAIDAEDLELLNRELATSPDRVRQFNDLRLVTGLIREHGRPFESGDAATCGTNSPLELSDVDSSVVALRWNAASKLLVSSRAVAATVAVLSTAAALFLFVNWSGTESLQEGSTLRNTNAIPF